MRRAFAPTIVLQFTEKTTVTGAKEDVAKVIAKLGDEAGEGLAKGAEVTVHYTEEGGKKVAHFFRKAS
jgi:hypothetical protein